ncbi:AAA family ATPase [Halobaculum sp. MBLA0143]|uniref:AAA family ATPase n=1 Tax=Halobaculum sp. MBLA0143 TaxID=3079933 RepID=UPI0035235979
MAHVERVSVEGFKKIEELTVEPGQFTVVTGRNNSGKTSLLEAIRLGCEPGSVDQFTHSDLVHSNGTPGRGVEKVFNRQRSESVVEVKVGDQEGLTRLRPAPVAQARAAVAQAAANLLESSAGGFEDLIRTLSDHREFEPIREEPEEGIPNLIADHIPTDSQWVRHGVSVLEVDGESYPIVEDPGTVEKAAGTFIHSLNAETGIDLAEKFDVRLSDEPEGEGITTIVPRGLVRRPSLPTEVSPDPRTSTNFVTHGTTIKPDKEEPIKTDNVGDFLREKEIVDDLKTFTLDDLIFDPEDGEKYSVPFEQMGEGFRAIVALLWELLDDDLPEVLFLEEPTTHMHPGYVREVVYFLIGLAMEEDIQLFVTTHSNDFLNDLFNENLRDDEVAFLEEEFKLFQMQDGAAKTLEYREAERSLTELYNDLRGL